MIIKYENIDKIIPKLTILFLPFLLMGCKDHNLRDEDAENALLLEEYNAQYQGFPTLGEQEDLVNLVTAPAKGLFGEKLGGFTAPDIRNCLSQALSAVPENEQKFWLLFWTRTGEIGFGALDGDLPTEDQAAELEHRISTWAAYKLSQGLSEEQIESEAVRVTRLFNPGMTDCVNGELGLKSRPDADIDW